MAQLPFRCGHGYLLAEHPTSGGRIYPIFGFFKFQLWTSESWYLASGVPADICKWELWVATLRGDCKNARGPAWALGIECTPQCREEYWYRRLGGMRSERDRVLYSSW